MRQWKNSQDLTTNVSHMGKSMSTAEQGRSIRRGHATAPGRNINLLKGSDIFRLFTDTNDYLLKWRVI